MIENQKIQQMFSDFADKIFEGVTDPEDRYYLLRAEFEEFSRKLDETEEYIRNHAIPKYVELLFEKYEGDKQKVKHHLQNEKEILERYRDECRSAFIIYS